MKRTAARDQPTFLAFLRTGRWFSAIPGELQHALVVRGQVVKVAAGRRIGRRGDPADGLFAVLDGSIRMAGLTDGGRDVLHMFVDPPSWFGEVSVTDGLPRTLELTAEVESELLHVPQRELVALLAAAPELWAHIARLLAYRLRLAVLALEDATGSPLARLARRLALMSEGYGDHAHAHRTIAISQARLAMALRISRQTTNQLLGQLAERGTIRLAYGEIEVLERAALLAIARTE